MRDRLTAVAAGDPVVALRRRGLGCSRTSSSAPCDEVEALGVNADECADVAPVDAGADDPARREEPLGLGGNRLTHPRPLSEGLSLPSPCHSERPHPVTE